MIHDQWNDRDISSYLDGQLAPERLAIFEKSLAQNSALRQRVDALRKTLALLHETPLRESPRNYLLSPSMVANPKPVRAPKKWPVGMMRLATSLTAAAFVLTLGLNVLTRGLAPAAVLESGENLAFMQNDSVQVREMEAPAMKLADATPAEDAEAAQEKAFAVEEPAVEPVVGAPRPEAELEASPDPDSEGEGATGIGGGAEQPISPEAAENLGVAEEEVEQKSAVIGEAADAVEKTDAVEAAAPAPVEDEDLSIKEDDVSDVADASYAEDETILAAAAEEPMALRMPEEREQASSRGIFRHWGSGLLPLPLPRWVPVSLGFITLLLLGVTLLLSRHRP